MSGLKQTPGYGARVLRVVSRSPTILSYVDGQATSDYWECSLDLPHVQLGAVSLKLHLVQKKMAQKSQALYRHAFNITMENIALSIKLTDRYVIYQN